MPRSNDLTPRQLENRRKETAAFIDRWGRQILDQAARLRMGQWERGATSPDDDLMQLALHQVRLLVWTSQSKHNTKEGRYWINPETLEVIENPNYINPSLRPKEKTS